MITSIIKNKKERRGLRFIVQTIVVVLVFVVMGTKLDDSVTSLGMDC
jgi:hypothetical protein